METKGDRIKRLREFAKLTRQQLAKMSGISQSLIGDYERGKFQPKPETCHKIASALGLPPEAILDMPPGSGFDNPQPYITKKVPLLGSIPAGPTKETWEVIDWCDVLLHEWGPNRFMLRVEGDSMSPKIEDRDFVLIENGPAITLESADHRICAVEFDGERTLKYVDVEWRGGQPARIWLRPRNEKYKPKEILPRECDKLRIIGIALTIKRDL